MPYAEGRVFHDADSHVMETPDWLVPYADPAVRARMRPLYVATVKPGEESFIEELRAPTRRRRLPVPARPTRSCSARTGARRAPS